MLVVDIKKNKAKSINNKGTSAADYNFDDTHFQIWGYKDGDLKRGGNPTQQLTFDVDMAKELRDAINTFLLGK